MGRECAGRRGQLGLGNQRSGDRHDRHNDAEPARQLDTERRVVPGRVGGRREGERCCLPRRIARGSRSGPARRDWPSRPRNGSTADTAENGRIKAADEDGEHRHLHVFGLELLAQYSGVRPTMRRRRTWRERRARRCVEARADAPGTTRHLIARAAPTRRAACRSRAWVDRSVGAPVVNGPDGDRAVERTSLPSMLQPLTPRRASGVAGSLCPVGNHRTDARNSTITTAGRLRALCDHAANGRQVPARERRWPRSGTSWSRRSDSHKDGRH